MVHPCTMLISFSTSHCSQGVRRAWGVPLTTADNSTVFRRAGNVHVIRRANMVTYRGPTMMANTLHACAVLLRRGSAWGWFINLSASDYPLMTPQDVIQENRRRIGSEMDKTTARAAAAAATFAFEQELCPCRAAVFFVGLINNYSGQLIILYPTPREINTPAACRAGQFTEHQNIQETAAQLPWLNISTSISIMDCADSEKPIELVGHHTWEQYIGQPMVQDVPDTCALLACVKCVEAVHRLQHKKLHGKGTTTFPYRAAPPDDLLEACRTDCIWKPGVGAYVCCVLDKIQKMGVPATTDGPTPAPCPPLPLRSWKKHRWNDFAAGGLSPGRVADLLYNNGPCIGVLWLSPWYHHFVGDGDDAPVYTSGCGPSDDDARSKIAELHPGQTAWHAVVCYGFRFRHGQMHVLVLDNQTPTGPRRWIDFEEFYAFYTLSV